MRRLLGRQKVGFIGNGAANWVRLNGVTVPAAGTYDVTVYAAVSGTRSLWLSVNGGPGSRSRSPAGASTRPCRRRCDVPLAAGEHACASTTTRPRARTLTASCSAAAEPRRVDDLPERPVTTPQLGAGQTLERDLDRHAAQATPPPAPTRWTVDGSSATPAFTLAGHGHRPGAKAPEAAISPTSSGRSPTNFWGPVGRDLINGEQDPRRLRHAHAGGVQYAKGLGVHANSTVPLVRPRRAGYDRFTAQRGRGRRESTTPGPSSSRSGPMTAMVADQRRR